MYGNYAPIDEQDDQTPSRSSSFQFSGDPFGKVEPRMGKFKGGMNLSAVRVNRTGFSESTAAVGASSRVLQPVSASERNFHQTLTETEDGDRRKDATTSHYLSSQQQTTNSSIRWNRSPDVQKDEKFSEIWRGESCSRNPDKNDFRMTEDNKDKDIDCLQQDARNIDLTLSEALMPLSLATPLAKLSGRATTSPSKEDLPHRPSSPYSGSYPTEDTHTYQNSSFNITDEFRSRNTTGDLFSRMAKSRSNLKSLNWAPLRGLGSTAKKAASTLQPIRASIAANKENIPSFEHRINEVLARFGDCSDPSPTDSHHHEEQRQQLFREREGAAAGEREGPAAAGLHQEDGKGVSSFHHRLDSQSSRFHSAPTLTSTTEQRNEPEVPAGLGQGGGCSPRLTTRSPPTTTTTTTATSASLTRPTATRDLLHDNSLSSTTSHASDHSSFRSTDTSMRTVTEAKMEVGVRDSSRVVGSPVASLSATRTGYQPTVVDSGRNPRSTEEADGGSGLASQYRVQLSHHRGGGGGAAAGGNLDQPQPSYVSSSYDNPVTHRPQYLHHHQQQQHQVQQQLNSLAQPQTHHQIQPQHHQVQPQHHQIQPQHHQIHPQQHHQIQSQHHQVQPQHHQIQPQHHQVQPQHHQVQEPYYQVQSQHRQVEQPNYQAQPQHQQVQQPHYQVQQQEDVGGREKDRTMPPPSMSIAKSKAEPRLIVNKRSYLVWKVLGKGGSSRVYEAVDEEKKMVVAIKRVDLSHADEAQAEGYVNEINMLRKLQGEERIVRLYDFENVAGEDLLYVVMEKGETDLASLLKNCASRNEVTPAMIKYYWTEMLHAVEVIHKCGIIHSDLKPANFLLVAGRLKLIDFGIASSVQSDNTSVIKDSQTGTFNFMSPEAIQDLSDPKFEDSGKRKPCIKISYKSDVWSLGCILYNLAYGKMPFGDIKIPILKLQAILNPAHQIPFPAEGVDPDLLDVLKSCLNREVKERPTIRELLEHNYVTGVAAPLARVSALSSLLDCVEGVLSPATLEKTRRALAAAGSTSAADEMRKHLAL